MSPQAFVWEPRAIWGGEFIARVWRSCVTAKLCVYLLQGRLRSGLHGAGVVVVRGAAYSGEERGVAEAPVRCLALE